MPKTKRQRATLSVDRSDLFDGLPDDIVISILCKLVSTARNPSDFITVLLTCKRLNRLGLHPLVLSRAGPKSLAMRAKNWSLSAHRFLSQCASAGNVEACYILGMIRFYCLQNRRSGLSLMAKAAVRSHAPALYSLSVIQFNGSGAPKNEKDLRAGVALCLRAASLGYIDALRELGHCVQDGYGVLRNAADGRRLLIEANKRELASFIRAAAPRFNDNLTRQLQNNPHDWPTFLRLYGKDSAIREPHPANRFLTEWFGSKEPGAGLRLCSHTGCGRPETRSNEYRKCSACGTVNYCSRACQAQDWKLRHKVECAPLGVWFDPDDAVDGGDGDEGEGRMVGDLEVVVGPSG